MAKQKTVTIPNFTAAEIYLERLDELHKRHPGKNHSEMMRFAIDSALGMTTSPTPKPSSGSLLMPDEVVEDISVYNFFSYMKNTEILFLNLPDIRTWTAIHSHDSALLGRCYNEKNTRIHLECSALPDRPVQVPPDTVDAVRKLLHTLARGGDLEASKDRLILNGMDSYIFEQQFALLTDHVYACGLRGPLNHGNRGYIYRKDGAGDAVFRQAYSSASRGINTMMFVDLSEWVMSRFPYNEDDFSDGWIA